MGRTLDDAPESLLRRSGRRLGDDAVGLTAARACAGLRLQGPCLHCDRVFTIVSLHQYWTYVNLLQVYAATTKMLQMSMRNMRMYSMPANTTMM